MKGKEVKRTVFIDLLVFFIVLTNWKNGQWTPIDLIILLIGLLMMIIATLDMIKKES